MPGTEDVSVRDLEREIAIMKREKYQTDTNIRRMEGSKRRADHGDAARATANVDSGHGQSRVDDVAMANVDGNSTKDSSPNGKRKAGDGEDGEKEAKADSGKRRKTSEKGSDVEDDGEKSIPDTSRNDDKKEERDKDDKKEQDADKAAAAERRSRKEIDSRPKAKEPEKRSMRLFGLLNGHLKAAAKKLDHEKVLPSTGLQQKAQQRMEEKINANRQVVLEQKRQYMDKQRGEERVKSEQLGKDIDEKTTLLLQKRLEAHYSCMMNFTRTKAEPTIFYLPAKMDKNSEKLLEETRLAIKHKIDSLKSQFQSTPEEDAARKAAAEAAAMAADAAADDDNAELRKEAEQEEQDQLRSMKESDGKGEEKQNDAPAENSDNEEKKSENAEERPSDTKPEGDDAKKNASDSEGSDDKEDGGKKPGDGSGDEADGK